MDHREVGRYWEGNAEGWTWLVREGYDFYRDKLNTPAFLEMLPDVAGLIGLDIGCGEGYNTRLLTEQGAQMTALDISQVFIRHVHQSEVSDPLGTAYLVASAVEMPFGSESFDFATAFMSFMDIPQTKTLLAEAYRVLKPGGFLQLSITHPCFDTPHRRNLRGEDGLTYAFEVGRYFENLDGEVLEWMINPAPIEVDSGLYMFKVPRFTHTISQWLNMLLETGFQLERFGEPRPSDQAVRECPNLQDAQVVAYFLHIRARKPE